MNQENSLIYCCCTSNLKLDIGIKEIKRKKRIRYTSILEMSLYFFLYVYADIAEYFAKSLK